MVSSEAVGSGAELVLRSALRGPARAGLTAAAGVGLLAGILSASVAALLHQAKVAATVIETSALEAALADGLLSPGGSITGAAQLPVPAGDATYLPDGTPVGPGAGQVGSPVGPGTGQIGNPVGPGAGQVGSPVSRPLTLAMLGDSTAVGYGCRTPNELPGVQLARTAAAYLGQPVRLVTHGVVGCGAADLGRQIAAVLPDAPDVVVIVIGGNDIRDKVPPGQSARLLGDGVAVLRARGIPVVAATCPDFGVIAPIPQPLRALLHTWSQRLANLQEKEVNAAGGLAIPVGRLVSPDFLGRPELFAADGFHPSGAGYARAVAALAPAVLDALAAVGTVSASGRFLRDRASDAG